MIFRDIRSYLVNNEIIKKYLFDTQKSKEYFANECKINVETLEQILNNGIIYNTKERFDKMATLIGVSDYYLYRQIPNKDMD